MVNIAKIRELSSKKGIKLVFLIEKLGLKSRTYFQDIEKTGRDISLERLEIIAETLDTTVEYLTDQTDSPEKQEKPAAISDELWNVILNDPKTVALFELLIRADKEQMQKMWDVLENK